MSRIDTALPVWLRRNTHTLRLAPIVLLVAAMPAAHARDEASSHDAAWESYALPEVTVTATRREDSLQSVPVAVSVLDGDDLETANLNNLEDMVRRVPSAAYRTGTSTKNVSMFIRGIGTVTTSGGIEPTVATVVDGVVLAHPGQTSMDLLDVDRVEVLRGPQGTLFGKNASGGVFNIVTRDPSREQYRYLDAAYFEGNESRLRVGVATELSAGTAWGSVTAMQGVHDGNVTNVGDGSRLNGNEKKGVRGKLVLKPARELNLTLGADYLDSRRTTVPVFVSPPDAAPLPLAPVVAEPGNRRVNLDYGMYNHDRNWGGSAQLDWNLDGHRLTAIAAWRRWENRQHQDVDLSPVRFIHDAGTVSLEQFSQEIRLASPKGGRFEYVAGVFHQRTDDRETYHRDLGMISNAQGDARFDIAHRNYALFGEGVFNVTPASRLIAGLRQTRNTIDYRFRRATSEPIELGVLMHNAFANEDGTRATGHSGRIGPQFDLAPGVMAYTTYSRGYKGPAYNVYANMWPADTGVVKPETSDAYELGLKYRGLDNRLRLNLALFSATYENYQTAVPGMVDGVTVMRLANAGKVGTAGLEADFSFKPGPRWEITGALAETHARVLRFDCGDSQIGCVEDGSTLPFAPRHRLTLGARHYLPLTAGRILVLGADYRWQSEVQFQLPANPETRQGAYGILDARIALDDGAGGWSLALVGKNLADTSYASYAVSQFGGLARFVPRDDRRYIGVDFRLDF